MIENCEESVRVFGLGEVEVSGDSREKYSEADYDDRPGTTS